MRKALSICLSLAVSALATHPFVGEHAESDTVERENGSIAVRLTQRTSTYNKYKGKVLLLKLNLSFRYNCPRCLIPASVNNSRISQ